MADAQITVGANADEVIRAAALVKGAWQGTGGAITTAIRSAASAVAFDLANMATALGKVSFSSQHMQVREFEKATARMAVASGRHLEGMRSEFEAVGKSIGRRPAEVAAWTAEVGKLTYNFAGAAQSIEGVAQLAAKTGRATEDYRQLAVELGLVGGVAGDTKHAIGTLAAQAEALGTVGGVGSFADQIMSLGDVVSHFKVGAESDFTRIAALSGELGKGLNPMAAQRVQQQALGAVAADPLRWERYLGHSITDKHGQVKDPTEVLRQITEKTKRRFGGDARRVLQLNFGAETGAALYNADYAEAAKLAHIAPSKKPGESLRQYVSTDAGRRDVAEAELAKSARALMGSSTLLGRAADALQRFSATSPLLGTAAATALGLGVPMAATKVAGSAIGGVARAAGGVAKVATGALSAAGAGLAAFAAPLAVGASSALAGYATGKAIMHGVGLDDDAQYDAARKRGASDRAADAETARLKQIRDRVRAARGMPPLGHAAPVKQEDSILARRAALGTKADLDAFAAKLKSEGASKADADAMAKTIADAIKQLKLDVNVVNASGGPIDVTDASGNSLAAGVQG